MNTILFYHTIYKDLTVMTQSYPYNGKDSTIWYWNEII